jgi:hypothetical protein
MCSRVLLSGLFLFAINCFAQVTFNYNQVPAEGITAIGDFNLDGYPDLAIFESGVLNIYLGVGGGNFNLAFINSTVPTATLEMYTADMNNDGNLDMVMMDGQSGKVFIFYGDGTGDFPSSTSVMFLNPGVPAFPSSTLRIGDFNGDGRVDLIATVCPDDGVTPCATQVKLNQGNGSFITTQVLPFIGTPLLLADISGDGKLDLIYEGGSANLAIRKGKGNGTFQSPSYLSLPTCPPTCVIDFQTADLDNDGVLDIAILFGNFVNIYKKNGQGGFTLAGSTTLPETYNTMAIADLNGDQKQDLVLSSFNHLVGGSFALGNGKGRFGVLQSLDSSFTGTSFLFSRDLELTSRQDIVGGAAPFEPLLGPTPIAINITAHTNCPPPKASKLAARVCSPVNNGKADSTLVTVKGSGNSPAGVQRLEVWIDGKKRGQRWADQIAQQFTLSTGTHRIVVVAVDKYTGTAKSAVYVRVP